MTSWMFARKFRRYLSACQRQRCAPPRALTRQAHPRVRVPSTGTRRQNRRRLHPVRRSKPCESAAFEDRLAVLRKPTCAAQMCAAQLVESATSRVVDGLLESGKIAESSGRLRYHFQDLLLAPETVGLHSQTITQNNPKESPSQTTAAGPRAQRGRCSRVTAAGGTFG